MKSRFLRSYHKSDWNSSFEALKSNWKTSHQIYKKMLANLLQDVLRVLHSPLYQSTIHPMHFLNVKIHNLMSQIASPLARFRQADPSLLRLSALALCHNSVWLERNASLLRCQQGGHVDAVAKVVAEIQENGDSSRNEQTPIPRDGKVYPKDIQLVLARAYLSRHHS